MRAERETKASSSSGVDSGGITPRAVGGTMKRSSWELFAAAMILAGCASIGPKVNELKPGMSTQQVLSILGEPADRSFRGTDEAWQYSEIAGFGQCKYTTVWISNGKLVGVSTRRGGSVAGCGLGSRPVDWSQMPRAGGGQ